MSTFGARDLLNLLPDEAGDISALRHTVTEGERDDFIAPKPKLDLSKKVKRHRKSKAPTMCAAASDDDEDDGNGAGTSLGGMFAGGKGNKGMSWAVKKEPAPSSSSKRSDSNNKGDSKADVVGASRQRIEASILTAASSASVVADPDSSSSSSSSDDDDEARARMRARVASRTAAAAAAAAAAAGGGGGGTAAQSSSLARPRIQAAVTGIVASLSSSIPDPGQEEDGSRAMKTGTEGARVTTDSADAHIVAEGKDEDDTRDTDSDSGSDSGSDSDGGDSDEDESLKPVFVPKAARDTVVEREEREAIAAAAELKRVTDRVARQAESRDLVAKTLELSASADAANNGFIGDPSAEAGVPDDTDFADEEEADLAAWRERELRRLVRERCKRREVEAERKDMARRKGMSEKQQRREDAAADSQGRRNESKGKDKDKDKRGFMQKYYHKGAFYMDQGSVRDAADVRATIDAGGATGEDKFDKKALPAVLQVRKFGFKGRTKYTHLADQDTTAKDSLWEQAQKGPQHKRQKR